MEAADALLHRLRVGPDSAKSCPVTFREGGERLQGFSVAVWDSLDQRVVEVAHFRLKHLDVHFSSVRSSAASCFFAGALPFSIERLLSSITSISRRDKPPLDIWATVKGKLERFMGVPVVAPGAEATVRWPPEKRQRFMR